METQPWTENTGDQAFMGSAVVGGVHVCARAYMCVFFLNKQKQRGGGGEPSEQ